MANSKTKPKISTVYLPESIISIILSRLPPKSISRFKSVSKSWCSLIRHPEFYKLQFLQSNQNNPNCDFSFFINKTSSSCATIDYETAYKKEAPEELLRYTSYIKIVGSCNGVICVYYDHLSLCLYNPSTKQLIKLPALPRIYSADLSLLGFGYDHKTNHFKVIAYADWDHLPRCSSPMWDIGSPDDGPTSSPAACYNSPDHGPTSSPAGCYNSPSSPTYDPSGSLPTPAAMRYDSPAPACSPRSYSPLSPQYSPYFLVYTVGGTDSWEKEQKPSIPRYNTSYERAGAGEHLNGAVHWVLTCYQYSGNPYILMSYDLAEEEYKVIPLPNNEERNRRQVKLGVLGGCLSICTSSVLRNEAEIWIMKDYGVEESWEKVFSISQLDIATPMCLSKEGGVFLARSNDLLLYDPKCDTVTILKCHISDICPYVRSFVPLACEEEDVMITG